MINVNVLPCADCMYCAGIKQPDGTQRSEYLACKVAQNSKASDLLKRQRGQIVCPKFRDLDDRMDSTDWNAIANLCRMVGDKAAIIKALDAWQETKHPRGKGGRFTKKGSGQSSQGESESEQSSNSAPIQQPKATGAYRKQYPHSNPRMSQATKNLADSVKHLMTDVSSKEMTEAISSMKDRCTDDKKWRVDVHTPEQYEEKGAKCFKSKGGACAAVTKGHDIISVCSNRTMDVSGKAMMAWAVANGGDRLDSYDGNIGFYIKCGFEPVAACKFNPKYAPEGWDPARDKRQPIVFMKYTGRSLEQIQKDFGVDGKQYKKKVKMFDKNGYDDAQAYRDAQM